MSSRERLRRTPVPVRPPPKTSARESQEPFLLRFPSFGTIFCSFPRLCVYALCFPRGVVRPCAVAGTPKLGCRIGDLLETQLWVNKSNLINQNVGLEDSGQP